jgi:hypothetical protein
VLKPTTKFRRLPREAAKSKQAGQAQVEFILSLMTFLFLIFCCFELLMAMYTISVMDDAAKEGVRVAILKGPSGAGSTCSSSGTTCTGDPFGITSTVTGFAQLSLHDISALTVNVAYPDGNNQVTSRVQVTVTYQYVPYINLSFFHPTITTTSEGRIVY